MKEQYTYAVARVRAKEISLLKKEDLLSVLSAESEEDAISVLYDKGFTGNGNYTTPENLLNEEWEKTLSFIRELIPDMKDFNVFLLADDFHNLKAAIKSVVRSEKQDGIYSKGGTVDKDLIVSAIKERNFSSLPEMMREPAEVGMNTLLKTGDGQLLDVIIDKAALTCIYEEGKKSDSALIKNYAEYLVALSNIKIAARSAVLKKSRDFIKNSVTECESLDVSSLVKAASEGVDELLDYLSLTKYSSLKDALTTSYSEFEKQCDNMICSLLWEEKSNPFTIGPIAAYYLAREIEIKAVRIVLSGVINGLDKNSVKERLRDLYV